MVFLSRAPTTGALPPRMRSRAMCRAAFGSDMIATVNHHSRSCLRCNLWHKDLPDFSLNKCGASQEPEL